MKILLEGTDAYIIPDDHMGLIVTIEVTVHSEIQQPGYVTRQASFSTNQSNMPLAVLAELLMNELLIHLPRKAGKGSGAYAGIR